MGERRAIGALACAISVAALVVVLAAVGCQSEDPGTGLNPRPEELPSAMSEPGSPAAANPVEGPRESCDDNALLSGCEPPSPGDADDPNAPSEEEPIDLGRDGDAGASDGSGTLGADAGALRAADAGAP